MSQAILVALVAALVGLAVRARWRNVSVAGVIALAAVAYPAVESVVDFLHVVDLIGRPTTLRALTREELLRIPRNVLENNLLVPAAGIGLAWLLGSREATWPTVNALDQRVTAWGRQLWLGVGAVPVVVVAEAGALFLLAGPGSVLNTADETALFANATPGIVALLCLVPALAEEIYYRGMLQSVLERVGPHATPWFAIGAQAVVFGVAHGSYTSIAHVLGPLVFGLGMGYLRSTVGLGASIVAHAGVNLFYFAVDPGAGSALLLAATGAAVLAGAWVLYRSWPVVWARLRAGPKPA
jgi:membrane protease YdiL (CAAX protease family)